MDINFIFLFFGLFFTRIVAESILHIGVAHNAIKSSPIKDWFLAGCAVILGQGSTISWSAVHRLHHKFADTCYDPLSPFHHSPISIWFNFIKVRQPNSVITAQVKDLIKSKGHLFCHRYYAYLHFAICVIIGLISPTILLIISPGIVYSFHVLGAINTLSHLYGKKVQNSAGRNNCWVSMFALLPGNHGSHHARKSH